MSVSFSPYFELSEEDAVKSILSDLRWGKKTQDAVRDKATALVENVRAQKQSAGQIESFLQEYALDTEEGLALMTLAEALLRVPDAATTKALIRDKIAAANWLERTGSSSDWVVKAAGVGLFMTNKTLDSVLAKIGEPFIREAMVKAMQILGRQFVLGSDIEDAMQNAQSLRHKGYRMSYDILGEGARTRVDADHYFESYSSAIDYIAERMDKSATRKPGISVKLSALHPRYEFAQKEICVPEMIDALKALCKKAAGYDIALTVDAEECARLNISIDIISSILIDPAFENWDGFGLAVQAYHKASLNVIDHMAGIAKANSRRIQMRLVKGAYWDTEIKLAQEKGLKDFPVYTRKAHSDASYIACAAKMFSHKDVIYPMFGTHNAHTAAAILHLAHKNKAPFEFQRLFGMGDALFSALLEDGAQASIYAPVGSHKDLLPYLVRRLLENGANSSFVNRILDEDAPVESLVEDPVEKSKNRTEFTHPKINLPRDLYKAESVHGRVNSSGLDLDAPEVEAQLIQAVEKHTKLYEATPMIEGMAFDKKKFVGREVLNPADFSDCVGQVFDTPVKYIDRAFENARYALPQWGGADVNLRAQALEHASEMLEKRLDEFIALLVREAGKTYDDAIGEIREAVDFLRYYAAQGRSIFENNGIVLPGPTGERNVLSLHARGVFVCISPWNFPLAIFIGQISAALMAGNSVLSKPAEQTCLIAAQMIKLMHESGVPKGALQMLPGDGEIGAALVAHKDVVGVAFTGSTEVAHEINVTLAKKRGPIVPFIAETGGQNAMIVDSSALPEQVIDDVILSAFGSAGQRCSALRVLCVQEDIADKMIRMLQGAMQEMNVGNPASLSSDLGPVIDESALSGLLKHREALAGFGEFIYEVPLPSELAREGHYFGPCAYEIPSISALDGEVFGPILHVMRYKASEIDDLLAEIRDTGYGLTMGVHSRISAFHERVIAQMPVGNIYVNRSIIGAVVGSQPFGGMGLSGTGPKAGGPHYLHRFAHERVVSTDTTATGGNASLVSLAE